ncbi:MAG: hypothetical protein EP297_01080 [Gammaproteobacteria bacterium]|nr:MAG: hypothetical protein EP297_01080 [Gammaproteobacteria bacterium]
MNIKKALQKLKNGLKANYAKKKDLDKLKAKVAKLEKLIAKSGKPEAKKAPSKKKSATGKKKSTPKVKAKAAPVKAVAKSAKPAARAATQDLKQIRGIGPVLEKKLNAQGIKNIKQIAAWSAKDVEAWSTKLGIKGRIEREKWVLQAKALG